MTTTTRLLCLASSLAVFYTFPGVLTLACLVVTGVAIVVDAVYAARNAA